MNSNMTNNTGAGADLQQVVVNTNPYTNTNTNTSTIGSLDASTSLTTSVDTSTTTTTTTTVQVTTLQKELDEQKDENFELSIMIASIQNENTIQLQSLQQKHNYELKLLQEQIRTIQNESNLLLSKKVQQQNNNNNSSSSSSKNNSNINTTNTTNQQQNQQQQAICDWDKRKFHHQQEEQQQQQYSPYDSINDTINNRNNNNNNNNHETTTTISTAITPPISSITRATNSNNNNDVYRNTHNINNNNSMDIDPIDNNNNYNNNTDILSEQKQKQKQQQQQQQMQLDTNTKKKQNIQSLYDNDLTTRFESCNTKNIVVPNELQKYLLLLNESYQNDFIEQLLYYSNTVQVQVTTTSKEPIVVNEKNDTRTTNNNSNIKSTEVSQQQQQQSLLESPLTITKNVTTTTTNNNSISFSRAIVSLYNEYNTYITNSISSILRNNNSNNATSKSILEQQSFSLIDTHILLLVQYLLEQSVPLLEYPNNNRSSKSASTASNDNADSSTSTMENNINHDDDELRRMIHLLVICQWIYQLLLLKPTTICDYMTYSIIQSSQQIIMQNSTTPAITSNDPMNIDNNNNVQYQQHCSKKPSRRRTPKLRIVFPPTLSSLRVLSSDNQKIQQQRQKQIQDKMVKTFAEIQNNIQCPFWKPHQQRQRNQVSEKNVPSTINNIDDENDNSTMLLLRSPYHGWNCYQFVKNVSTTLLLQQQRRQQQEKQKQQDRQSDLLRNEKIWVQNIIYCQLSSCVMNIIQTLTTHECCTTTITTPSRLYSTVKNDTQRDNSDTSKGQHQILLPLFLGYGNNNDDTQYSSVTTSTTNKGSVNEQGSCCLTKWILDWTTMYWKVVKLLYQNKYIQEQIQKQNDIKKKQQIMKRKYEQQKRQQQQADESAKQQERNTNIQNANTSSSSSGNNSDYWKQFFGDNGDSDSDTDDDQEMTDNNNVDFNFIKLSLPPYRIIELQQPIDQNDYDTSLLAAAGAISLSSSSAATTTTSTTADTDTSCINEDDFEYWKLEERLNVSGLSSTTSSATTIEIVTKRIEVQLNWLSSSIYFWITICSHYHHGLKSDISTIPTRFIDLGGYCRHTVLHSEYIINTDKKNCSINTDSASEVVAWHRCQAIHVTVLDLLQYIILPNELYHEHILCFACISWLQTVLCAFDNPSAGLELICTQHPMRKRVFSASASSLLSPVLSQIVSKNSVLTSTTGTSTSTSGSTTKKQWHRGCSALGIAIQLLHAIVIRQQRNDYNITSKDYQWSLQLNPIRDSLVRFIHNVLLVIQDNRKDWYRIQQKSIKQQQQKENINAMDNDQGLSHTDTNNSSRQNESTNNIETNIKKTPITFLMAVSEYKELYTSAAAVLLHAADETNNNNRTPIGKGNTGTTVSNDDKIKQSDQTIDNNNNEDGTTIYSPSSLTGLTVSSAIKSMVQLQVDELAMDIEDEENIHQESE